MRKEICSDTQTNDDNNNYVCCKSKIKRTSQNYYHYYRKISIISNTIGSFIIFIVLLNLSNLCNGDVEPKPHYDDATTIITVSTFCFENKC